ncbi:MAG: hypothetical protein ACOCVS_00755 [Planctomycetota bacterium]
MDLERESAEVEEQLRDGVGWDPARGGLDLQAFDSSQNAADIWSGSKTDRRRQFLAAIFSHRALGNASACRTRRSPFHLLAEGASLSNGRPYCSQVGADQDRIHEFIKPFIDSGLGGLSLAIDLAKRVA